MREFSIRCFHGHRAVKICILHIGPVAFRSIYTCVFGTFCVETKYTENIHTCLIVLIVFCILHHSAYFQHWCASTGWPTNTAQWKLLLTTNSFGMPFCNVADYQLKCSTELMPRPDSFVVFILVSRYRVKFWLRLHSTQLICISLKLYDHQFHNG